MSEQKVATREECDLKRKNEKIKKVEAFKNLKLHEYLEINGDLVVTRVVGGWLYETTIDTSVSTTFVPFNAEVLRAMTDELIAGF